MYAHRSQFLFLLFVVYRTALMLAALGRHTDCVHILLEKGANADAADKKGFTALHRAVSLFAVYKTHHYYFLSALNYVMGTFLFKTQDVPDVLFPSHIMCRVLLLQAMLGSEDCVSALLEHGASALCRDSQGRTPLHLTASLGHTELLRTLLIAAMKADPLDSILDYRGCTPTHWAAYHGKTWHQESNVKFSHLQKEIGSVLNKANMCDYLLSMA